MDNACNLIPRYQLPKHSFTKTEEKENWAEPRECIIFLDK